MRKAFVLIAATAALVVAAGAEINGAGKSPPLTVADRTR
jgi:hypothetical protein